MRHVAVVGGGFTGTLQAIQLLRHGAAKVTLIERGDRPARGVAYATPWAEHLLNVRAAGMSAFPDQPEHFARWLEPEGGSPATFAQRRLYGRYLEDLLDQARAEFGPRLELIAGEVVDIAPEPGFERLLFATGASWIADAVILAIGNLEPDLPRGIDPQRLGERYVADPWAGDIVAGLNEDDTVLLIGTGLTAIDAALILDAAGFRGQIVALSRRGLVARPHAEPAPPPLLNHALEPRCTSLLAGVREAARRVGWRAAIDQLRPITQALWAAAAPVERKRFLRHLRPWWDVHRHRIAPEIEARVRELEAAGRIRFEAGKLLGADDETVTWRPRGTGEARELRAARIVNCTGPQGDIARAREPLLANLIKAGRIRPDVCRIGIDVDPGSRAIDGAGNPVASLFAVGPMTRGAWWEIVAVPDIRTQLAAVAKRVARG